MKHIIKFGDFAFLKSWFTIACSLKKVLLNINSFIA